MTFHVDDFINSFIMDFNENNNLPFPENEITKIKKKIEIIFISKANLHVTHLLSLKDDNGNKYNYNIKIERPFMEDNFINVDVICKDNKTDYIFIYGE